ncbi:MAG: hypothetical protein A2201_01410 [Alicyclobacillus sp. RIFOXYA1_FULL_53_8]|nr:MAG: hypothetical protein A2201_01410 [Alicyclobacillus sp. RIFOXYA1_FULL_53_8]
MSSRPNFQDIYEHLSQTHLVPDLVSPSARLIFILESPHVQEVRSGAPVSGTSGASMSKHLFGSEYAKSPLGLLAKKHAETESESETEPDALSPALAGVHRIGLMNVSNIPLQGSAYANLPLTSGDADMGDWFHAMEHVRTGNQTDEFRSWSANQVQTVLAGFSRGKLQSLTTRPCVLVPCGKFAQKFFRLADVHSEVWQVITGVPHPSYNSWDRNQYQSVVAQVQQAYHRASFE